jgi:hypothetical protein
LLLLRRTLATELIKNNNHSPLGGYLFVEKNTIQNFGSIGTS